VQILTQLARARQTQWDVPKIEVENECGAEAEEEEEAARTKRTASGKYIPATPAGMGGERLDAPARLAHEPLTHYYCMRPQAASIPLQPLQVWEERDWTHQLDPQSPHISRNSRHAVYLLYY
jgi:hypothetical protein